MKASARINALGDANVGANGRHFLDTMWHAWMFQAGEIHIFPDAASCQEPQHMDGAASCLHMGLTLFGRRRVVCQQGNGLELVTMLQVPGSIYFGCFTGPLHQVIHEVPLGQDEVSHMQKPGADGPSASSCAVMFRCCVFPHNRARLKNVMPTPLPVWEAVQASRLEMMQASCEWKLPDLASILATIPE